MFSQAVKYAVSSLIELALRGEKGPVKIRDLAHDLGIPYPFLAKIFPELVRAGIVVSTRGRGGGVRFARSPNEVSLADVIRAIEGDRFFDDCLLNLDPCEGHEEACPYMNLWDPVRDRVREFMESLTIGELAERRKE
ncbi:RrF2 family transcriptional regulator [Candidatus Bipolaricaulota sp. J31]